MVDRDYNHWTNFHPLNNTIGLPNTYPLVSDLFWRIALSNTTYPKTNKGPINDFSFFLRKDGSTFGIRGIHAHG